MHDDAYRDWHSPDYLRDVWGDWHKTTVPLPEHWSCEWGGWFHTSRLFHPLRYPHQLERNITSKFGIPARAIEPLVFWGQWADESLFVFAAEGRYYYYDGAWEKLWEYEYEGEFADHDEFLRSHVNEPNWPICRGRASVLNPPEWNM